MRRSLLAIKVYLEESRWAVRLIVPLLFLTVATSTVDYLFPKILLLSTIGDWYAKVSTSVIGIAGVKSVLLIAVAFLIKWVWDFTRQAKTVSEKLEEREATIRKCLYKFDPTVSPLTMNEAKAFLSKPNERKDLDITRMVMSEFVCQIDALAELISRYENENIRIKVLAGRRGAGLTTGLRYAAWKLRRGGENDVYFVDQAKFGDEEFVVAIKAALVLGAANGKKSVYVLCDDFALDKDVKDVGLSSVMSLVNDRKNKQLKVLLASRSSLSSHGLSSISLTLSNGDLRRILERLNTVFDDHVTWTEFNADLAVGIGQTLTLDSVISSYRARQAG